MNSQEHPTELSAERLAELSPQDLTTELTRIADLARDAALKGDTGTLREVRELLRNASFKARGEQMRLLQVAKSFVRDLGRTEQSGRERALREFLRKNDEAGRQICKRWIDGQAIRSDELKGSILLEQLDLLFNAGVIERHRGAWWLTAEARSIAQDLLEPLVFRIWADVTAAREKVAELSMNTSVAAETLAMRLGVDVEQATWHLQQHPINAVRLSDAQVARKAKREQYVVWRAPLYTERKQPPLADQRAEHNPLAATAMSQENATLRNEELSAPARGDNRSATQTLDSSQIAAV